MSSSLPSSPSLLSTITTPTQPITNHSSPIPPPLPPLSPLQNFIAGGCAGLLTRSVVAPLDVIKVRFQLQTQRGQFYTSIPQAFYRIVRDEGIFALWKGNLLGSLMSSPYSAITLTSQKYIKHHCFSDSNDAYSNAISGGIAGIIATGTTYPLDFLRSRFIAQIGSDGYTSIFNALSTIYNQHGFRGMFEGLSPALVGIVPYMAVQFAIYEGLMAYIEGNLGQIKDKAKYSAVMLHDIGVNKFGLTSEESNKFIEKTGLYGVIDEGKKLKNDQNNDKNTQKDTQNSIQPRANLEQNTPPPAPSRPLWVVPFVGFISGASGKAVSFPMDMLKRRMQMNTFIHTYDQQARPNTRSMFLVAKAIFQKEGFFAFYKGLVPSLLKSGPSASLMFVFYEAVVKIIRAGEKGIGNEIKGV